ncbi:MAG: P-loop NTPase [Bacteroidales bacterium]|nr:P-loop NTPase [Bacteroidales bacterium]
MTFDKKILDNVKNIVVVASGKGGVGKSTVAANLAITLAKQGYKTALVDADIYGPSVPAMFGVDDEAIRVNNIDGVDMMVPFEKYGVKVNSIGFMIDMKSAIIWRGPLAASALAQLITNTLWGELDYMIIDFPPGTGDIQISVMQQFEVDGAIVVTTPQVIAVNDARRGAEMFSPEKMDVPLVGIVENMSWFTPQAHKDEKYFLFGQGGGQALAEEFGTSLLAQLPLIKGVGEAAEMGANLIESGEEEIKKVFSEIADKMRTELENIKANKTSQTMKIAVPTVDGKVDDHFGHCDHYTVFEVDSHRNILNTTIVPAAEGCGCQSNIASVLSGMGVSVMLAGNMGDGAKNVLEAEQIHVIRGCQGDVTELVNRFMQGQVSDCGHGCGGHEGGCSHNCGHHHC